ncbi:MAG: hypothetical protein IJ529_03960 [Alphaproteobacteria bacterium]|nr:hypothetical protein [Alphaproteobacteria bacterium]
MKFLARYFELNLLNVTVFGYALGSLSFGMTILVTFPFLFEVEILSLVSLSALFVAETISGLSSLL